MIRTNGDDEREPYAVGVVYGAFLEDCFLCGIIELGNGRVNHEIDEPKGNLGQNQ